MNEQHFSVFRALPNTLVAAKMGITSLVACTGLFFWAADPVSAQERIRVAPTSVTTWDAMVRQDQAIGPSMLDNRRVIPFQRVSRATPSHRVANSMELDSGILHELPSPMDLRTSCLAGQVEPVVVTDFQALLDNGTIIPPDTMGAVGPNHVMTMLNSQVRVHSKTGGTISTVSLFSFWSSVTNDPFDPKLVFDSLSGRWIATIGAEARAPSSKTCFAISDTNNPLGIWRFYQFDGDPGDTTWVDFPSFGLNSTWIAITANMYTNSADVFQGREMWVIDKASALAGGALTVTVLPTAFDGTQTTDLATLQPCVTFDASEPALYLVDNNSLDPGDNTNLLRISQITGTGPAPAWSVVPGSSYANTGLFRVSNSFNNTLINASQLGTANRIATDDARLWNAVFRNGRIWTTHHAGLPASGSANRTAAFWYQLDPNAMPNPIVQSGVLDGGTDVHHFYPSVAVNCGNDMCIGFSRSEPTRYCEAVYAIRLGTDPAGSTRSIHVLKAGEHTYYKTFGSPDNRWGDYSSTVVDPVDDRTFWTLQEYAAQSVGGGPYDDRWGTWWGKIAQNCNSIPVVADSFADFSGVQGQGGWHYGYLVSPYTSATFQELTQYGSDPDFSGVVAWHLQLGSGGFWTCISQTFVHPNGPTTSGGRQNVGHWVTRRWVSSQSGLVRMTGRLYKYDANACGGCDGVTGRIRVNGTEIWTQFIAQTDAVGVSYNLTVNVNVGSTVDFILDPNGYDGKDASVFSAKIFAGGDCNADGVFDACQCCTADANGDGTINGMDIGSFVGTLINPPTCASQFAQFCRTDVNHDNVIDILDVDPFVQRLLAGAICP